MTKQDIIDILESHLSTILDSNIISCIAEDIYDSQEKEKRISEHVHLEELRCQENRMSGHHYANQINGGWGAK